MDIRSRMFDAHHKDAIVHYPAFQPASIVGLLGVGADNNS